MTTRSLPYRAAVGIMLINHEGHIWIGRRFEKLISNETLFRWQMPQGGIDPGEPTRVAAIRELKEETGAFSISILSETPDWLVYDLPPEVMGHPDALKGRYRGQRMKWFLMRFTGDESEFDISRINDHSPEFDAWRWAAPEEIVPLVVPFKRGIYEAVLNEFRPLLLPPA